MTREDMIKNAYYGCKFVADSIVDEESYQKADKGLVMFYIDTIVKALRKQIPMKPRIWKNKYPDSPVPNDDWGYECPCCGNQDIDYPEHHCTCGQALDWTEEGE